MTTAARALNPQLAYYAAAALHSRPRWFKGRDIAVAIVQPRGDTVLDYTVVYRKELQDFAEDIAAAAGRALGRDPPLAKGAWCKWCPAKPTCPRWTGPLLDLVALQDATPATLRERSPLAYGDFLSRAKEFSELVGEYGKEVDRQLQAFLEAGGQVPRLDARAEEEAAAVDRRGDRRSRIAPPRLQVRRDLAEQAGDVRRGRRRRQAPRQEDSGSSARRAAVDRDGAGARRQPVRRSIARP